MLAARGTREGAQGEEAIGDPALAQALRARARGIWLRTLVVTVLGTILLVLLPI